MPELKEIIAEKGLESLEEIQKWAKTTNDFAQEQIPLVVHEVIAWGLASHISYMIIFGTVLTICSVIWYILNFSLWGRRNWEGNDYWNSPTNNQVATTVSNVVIGFIFGIFFCLFWEQMTNVLFIWFAPRLYVLQELARLLKK